MAYLVSKEVSNSCVIVTGTPGKTAALSKRLLGEGWTVYASILRRLEALKALAQLRGAGNYLKVHVVDLLNPLKLLDLVASVVACFLATCRPRIRTRRLRPGVEARRSSIDVQRYGVDVLVDRRETYDCIWSISGVEHVFGEYDDSSAIALIYDSLKNGDSLILTVPVDRKFQVEYRDQDYYGTQPYQILGKHFFRCVYGKDASWERLLSPIKEEPSIVRWSGEVSPGIFRRYEQRCISEGRSCAIEDPREMADHYRAFSIWEEIPDFGICGLLNQKTRSVKPTGKAR